MNREIFSPTFRSFSAPSSEKIKLALLVHVFNQTTTSLLTSFLCATVVLIGLYNTGNNTVLLAWYAFFIVVMMARFVLVVIFQRQRYPEKHLSLWENLYILGSFLGGVNWGLTGVILFSPHAQLAQTTLIILILAGVTAGAVPFLSAVLKAAYAFLIPALLMLIVHLFFIQNTIYDLFNIALSAYLVYLLMVATKTHAMIKHSTSLRFDNDALLKELSDANNKLEYSATHDPLTEVANRNLFEITFTSAIQRAERNQKMLALLYIDLDNFKEVNDVYGHHIGDQVIFQIAERLKMITRIVDHISRLGGDEFTIILENISDLKDVSEISQRICATLSLPIRIYDFEFHITASIGISIYPMDGHDISTLLKVADKAMYYVKQHGHNNFYFNVDRYTESDLS